MKKYGIKILIFIFLAVFVWYIIIPFCQGFIDAFWLDKKGYIPYYPNNGEVNTPIDNHHN